LIAVAGRVGAAGKVSRIEVAFAGRRYLDAVRRAHAEPVTLTPRRMSTAEAERLLGRFDGLVLLGGADVDPALYGEEPHDAVYGVHREQDDFEIALVQAAAEMQFPVLAICRGLQVANVALGGSLIQHLPDHHGLIDHAPVGFPSPPEGVLHTSTVMADSRLAGFLGTTQPTGASYHHQAINRLGADLVAVASASDDIVEAIEHCDDWLLGVQWHPEDTAAHDPVQQRLFDQFVTWAAQR
jgi:putative glutamine amidotransferase